MRSVSSALSVGGCLALFACGDAGQPPAAPGYPIDPPRQNEDLAAMLASPSEPATPEPEPTATATASAAASAAPTATASAAATAAPKEKKQPPAEKKPAEKKPAAADKPGKI